MNRLFIAAAIMSYVGITSAYSQGVAQQPAQTATGITQQRQNGNGVGSGYATSTNPPTNTFNSPFASPFGSSKTTPQKGGYAGNGSR